MERCGGCLNVRYVNNSGLKPGACSGARLPYPAEAIDRFLERDPTEDGASGLKTVGLAGVIELDPKPRHVTERSSRVLAQMNHRSDVVMYRWYVRRYRMPYG